MTTMRRIDHQPGGDISCLRLVEEIVPTAGPGEVLIKVAHAGVNRPDLLQRAGTYPAPPGACPYLGLEVSGTVVAHGDGVMTPAIGVQICALTPGGGYADFVTAPATHCMPLPEGISLREAACLPETMMTVWANLIERGQLRAGQRVLIHGGSSGIGTTAIQVARWVGADRIFTTVGSQDKAQACRQLGAHRPILYRTEDFQKVIKEETDGQGVHLVLDMVGGDYMAKHLRVLANDGRMVSIAFLNGADVKLDWTPLMIKRITFTGSTLRARSSEEKARIALAMQQSLWPELARGQMRPLIHAEFPLADVAKAHALMESSQHIGKIVLNVNP
jgi:NADPH:quinone reductase